MLEFTLPIPPSVNSYLKIGAKYVVGRKGKKIPVGYVYRSEEANVFLRLAKKRIDKAVNESRWQKTGEFEYVYCDIDAFIQHKKVDCDNLLKCTLDAIKECDAVYDDCMIIPRFNNVFIDSENPHLEITISKASKVGVFKDIIEFEKFKTLNCLQCKKYKTYKDRCSIIQNSLHNKIITENITMENLRCQKLIAKNL